MPYVAFVAMKGVDLCADAFDEEELEGFIFSKKPPLHKAEDARASPDDRQRGS